MESHLADEAARLVWRHWLARTRIDALPASCRPSDRRAGYAVQAGLAHTAGQAVVGWKIAATSVAGQQHIGVDGPLAGRLFAERLLDSGATVPLSGNLMRVAEAEFVFRTGQSLPPRTSPYSAQDVQAAVTALHPGIEVPDSRFADFARAGGPQLIADNACTDWFVLGAEVRVPWRECDLAQHRVVVHRNGAPACEGSGALVLGNPWHALAWVANELREYGPGLREGDLVTTGTCIVPLAVAPGDHVRADFGAFGAVDVRLR
jgi:2-keto-4-pentenoate hydratase